MTDATALIEAQSGPDIVERLLRRWPGNGKYLNPDGPKAAALERTETKYD